MAWDKQKKFRKPDPRRILTAANIADGKLTSIVEEDYTFYYKITLEELDKRKDFPFEHLTNEELTDYLSTYNNTLSAYDDMLFVSFNDKGEIRAHSTTRVHITSSPSSVEIVDNFITPEKAAKLDYKKIKRERDKLAKDLKDLEFEKKKRDTIDAKIDTLINKMTLGTANEEDMKAFEKVKLLRQEAVLNGPGETKHFVKGIEKRTKNIEEAYEELKALGGHMSEANITKVIDVKKPGKPSIDYLNYEFPEQTTLKNPLEPEFGIAERWAEKVKQNGVKFPRDNPTPQLIKGTYQDYTQEYFYSKDTYNALRKVRENRKASEKRENLTSKAGVLEKDFIQKDVKVEATQTIKEVLDADKNLMKVDLYDSKGVFSGTGYYKKSHKKDYYVKNPHYTNILDKNGVPVTKGEFFEKRMIKGEAQYREIKAMTIDNKLVNTAETSLWKPITEVKDNIVDKTIPAPQISMRAWVTEDKYRPDLLYVNDGKGAQKFIGIDNVYPYKSNLVPNWDPSKSTRVIKPQGSLTNAQYWRKREEAILKQPIKDYETALQELYKKELEDVLKLYKEAVDNNASQSKIYMLEENIDMFTKKMEKTQKDWTSSLLYNTYKDSIAAAEAHLASMGLKRMGILPDDAIKRVLMTPWAKDGEFYYSRIWKNEQKMKKLLSQTLQTGLARGYSVDKMSVVMRDAFTVDFNQARRLIRTESMHFMNQGHLDSYKRHGIEYVEYVATDDDLCCADCEEMDGQIIAISDLNYDNQPPLHPNCRCTLAPVIAEDIGETN